MSRGNAAEDFFWVTLKEIGKLYKCIQCTVTTFPISFYTYGK